MADLCPDGLPKSQHKDDNCDNEPKTFRNEEKPDSLGGRRRRGRKSRKSRKGRKGKKSRKNKRTKRR